MSKAPTYTVTEKAIIAAGKNVKNGVFTLVSTLAISFNENTGSVRIWTDRAENLLMDEKHGVNLSEDYAPRVVRMAKHVAPKVKDVTKPEALLKDNIAAILDYLTKNYTLATLRAEMSGNGANKPPAEGPSKKDLQEEVAQLRAKLADAEKAVTAPPAPVKSKVNVKAKPEDAAKLLAAWVKDGHAAAIIAAMDLDAVIALAQALNARMAAPVEKAA